MGLIFNFLGQVHLLISPMDQRNFRIFFFFGIRENSLKLGKRKSSVVLVNRHVHVDVFDFEVSNLNL